MSSNVLPADGSAPGPAALAAADPGAAVASPRRGVLAYLLLVVVLTAVVDAAILVVRAGITKFPDLQTAAQAIGPERILGVVLNAVEPNQIHREDYYGAYYGYGARD